MARLPVGPSEKRRKEKPWPALSIRVCEAHVLRTRRQPKPDDDDDDARRQVKLAGKKKVGK